MVTLTLCVNDLLLKEEEFQVPSRIGTWNFYRASNYAQRTEAIENGQCAITYFAYNEAVDSASLANVARNQEEDPVFDTIWDDFVNICLMLSWLTGKCVTTSGTHPCSDIQSAQLPDRVLRSRAISGMPSLPYNGHINDLFSIGLETITAQFADRWMPLHFAHWISGITCFTLEDLYLSLGVQMDIVKQCEINTDQAAGILDRSATYTYFKGMSQASQRYAIPPLDQNYKDMRNDLLHYGKLSCHNFIQKDTAGNVIPQPKAACAMVVADVLNWLDRYFAKVTQIDSCIPSYDRWQVSDLKSGLPAISL